MNTKRSVLRAILDQVYTSKSFEDALNTVKTRLDDPTCVIHGAEKNLIIMRATDCLTLVKLQMYITNSFLKYEKMGCF